MPLFGKLDVGMFVCMPVIKLYLDFRKQFFLKFSFLLGQYGWKKIQGRIFRKKRP